MIRANAHKAILALGTPGLAALRRALAVGADSDGHEVSPELLFVLAADIGREPRNLRLETTWGLDENST